jgi:lipooligosaccharide transport system permease protein
MSMPQVSYHSFRVWQRNRDVFFHLWKTELMPYLVEPVVILAAMGFGLGAYIGLIDGQSYLHFIVPGIIAAYAMFSATFECTYGSYVRMEHQKTYDAIIVTPVNIEDVIAGEIFWAATRALMTGCIILLISLAFQAAFSPLTPLVLLVIVLEGLLFGSIAMVFTSITPSITAYNYFFTLFLTPMFFFSGVFFPLSEMPSVVQHIAWFLPLTPLVNLDRALISGQLTPDLLGGLAYIVALTVFFFILSLITMRRRLIK